MSTLVARPPAGEPGSALPAGRLVEVEELVLRLPDLTQQQAASSTSSSTASSAAGGEVLNRLYRGHVALARTSRPPGRNDCGMVAWVMTLRTPECPQVRRGSGRAHASRPRRRGASLACSPLPGAAWNGSTPACRGFCLFCRRLAAGRLAAVCGHRGGSGGALSLVPSPAGRGWCVRAQGRQVVAVANDLTFQSGAFSPREDALFKGAAELACQERLPLVYLAANSGARAAHAALRTPGRPPLASPLRQACRRARSGTRHFHASGAAHRRCGSAARRSRVGACDHAGARVGLAVEVRDRLQVAWADPQDPSQGFKYLYLSPEDHAHLQTLATQQGKGERGAASSPSLSLRSLPLPLPLFGSRRNHTREAATQHPNRPTCRAAAALPPAEILHATPTPQPDGSTRFVLTDVVGLEDGLGVECLSGSGAIAAAFNKAFREGYTVTLVSGRTVGIGAYLARLGRRCVQRVDQPIILTGCACLLAWGLHGRVGGHSPQQEGARRTPAARVGVLARRGETHSGGAALAPRLHRACTQVRGAEQAAGAAGLQLAHAAGRPARHGC